MLKNSYKELLKVRLGNLFSLKKDQNVKLEETSSCHEITRQTVRFWSLTGNNSCYLQKRGGQLLPHLCFFILILGLGHSLCCDDIDYHVLKSCFFNTCMGRNLH